MQRRDFITLLGGAAATWPLAARAQQPKLVIGYLHSASPGPYARFVGAFRAGLQKAGYIEGQNLTIEYRWAEGHYERLPPMAGDLVSRGVAVIATGGAEFSVLAAKAATSTIPVVFVMGGDPIKLGIVPSFARPAGNVTGINMLTATLENKRFGLLHELVPNAQTIGVMVNPSRAVVHQSQIDEGRDAAKQLGVRVLIVEARSESDFEPAFARLSEQGVGALQICADPFFNAQRQRLVALSAKHWLPAIYEWRDFAEAGGLISYGTDLADAYRQVGGYVAKILNGTKPADLPVVQPTKFELVINLKTAMALGLTVPYPLLARANEVIE